MTKSEIMVAHIGWVAANYSQETFNKFVEQISDEEEKEKQDN